MSTLLFSGNHGDLLLFFIAPIHHTYFCSAALHFFYIAPQFCSFLYSLRFLYKFEDSITSRNLSSTFRLFPLELALVDFFRMNSKEPYFGVIV